MSSGNSKMPMILAIVLVLAIAGGAMAYFSKNMKNERAAPAQTAEADNAAGTDVAEETPATGDEAQTASGTDAAASDEDSSAAAEAAGGTINGVEVEEGNPVVARVDGKDITRVDVYNYIKMMPANIQQLPPAAIYPIALEQVINTRLVQNKAEEAGLESDPEVKKQMNLAEQQIIRSVYVQREVEKEISENDLRKAYDDAVARMGDLKEMKASHILVDSEAKAKDIISKLDAGEDFAKLARENSADPSNKENGGDLGWFTKQDMVPEFADAVFQMNKGQYTKAPIQTQFGYHVVKVDDLRDRPKPSYDELKPMLKVEVQRQKLEQMLDNWKQNANIEKFDINGKPVAANDTPTAATDVMPAAGNDNQPAADDAAQPVAAE